MSSEIWKVGQEINAQSMFKNINDNGINGCWSVRGEVAAVKVLTQMCNQMTTEFDEILDDQNEYLIEMENADLNFENLKADINEKIKQLYEEIKALEKKEQNGSITEEEQEELKSKKGELDALMKDSDNKVEEQVNAVKSKGDEKIQSQKSKIAVAKNYGEVTVEKGTPLSETEVSSGFFKKLFGCTGKSKKEAGEEAVEAGNNLLDKVTKSNDINDEIDKHYKNFKTT